MEADFRKFPRISADFRRFPQISAGFRRFSQICADFRSFFLTRDTIEVQSGKKEKKNNEAKGQVPGQSRRLHAPANSRPSQIPEASGIWDGREFADLENITASGAACERQPPTPRHA